MHNLDIPIDVEFYHKDKKYKMTIYNPFKDTAIIDVSILEEKNIKFLYFFDRKVVQEVEVGSYKTLVNKNSFFYVDETEIERLKNLVISNLK